LYTLAKHNAVSSNKIVRLRTFLAIVMLANGLSARAESRQNVVISQVHSAFVEIFNRGPRPVSIDGWSLQCEGPSYVLFHPVWGVIPLSGTLKPGQYYLIEVDGSNTLKPDAYGSFVPPPRFVVPVYSPVRAYAIVPSTQPLADEFVPPAETADLFGYGVNNASDGSPFPVQLGASYYNFGPLAAVRRQAGCLAEHNNSTDFVLGAPAPRTMRSPMAPCSTAPAIQTGGVINAASRVAGAVAPGEMITIRGSNLVSADPGPSPVVVRVLFDGFPSTVLHTSSSEIDAVVPSSVGRKRQTKLQVEVDGVVSDPVTLELVGTAPGIFTTKGSGTGQCSATNDDQTQNGVDHPASSGAVVTVYATGLGINLLRSTKALSNSTIPPVRPAPRLSATIGGLTATVLAASQVPGQIGVETVRVQVPGGLTGRQELLLTAEGRTSQADASVQLDFNATAPANTLKISVVAVDLAYDPGTHRLYAAIASTSTSHPNEIAVINPSSGAILDWIPVGKNPTRIVLSDDGRYLYIVLRDYEFVYYTAPTGYWVDAIQRVDLKTRGVDFTLKTSDLYSGVSLDPLVARLYVPDIAVLPGQPRSLALTAWEAYSIYQPPIIVIDDTARRRAVGPWATWLNAGTDGSLWTDQGQRLVNQVGVFQGQIFPGNVDTDVVATMPAGDRLISSTGLVMDSTGAQLLGRFPVNDPRYVNWPTNEAPSFVYRSDTGLAYYMRATTDVCGPGFGFGPAAFDPHTFLLSGRLANCEGPGIAQRLVSVGPAGLATASGDLGGSSALYIYPLSALLPPSQTSLPPAQAGSNSLRRFSLPSSGMAATPAGDRLYLSIPSSAPPIGNSVVAFDVASGTFGSQVWVGSEPGAMAVSSDTQYLHVVLGGSHRMLRMSLPGLTVEKSFPLTTSDGSTLTDVSTVLNLPRDTSVAVVEDQHYGVMWIYDDGVKRANAAAIDPSNVHVPAVFYASITADGATLYGLSSIGGGLSQWSVAPDGLHFVAVGSQPNASVSMGSLACQADMCFTGTGTILSTSTLLPVGQAAVDTTTWGMPLIDLANNRMFLISAWGADLKVTSYDATSYQMIGQYVLSQFARPHSVQLMSGNQLAIANSKEFALLPISLLISH
jgi:uncharacterized protein (TIGR03437 family)